jgi:hypothetical protein
MVVPEGRTAIAQQFTAGEMDSRGRLRPVGTLERSILPFAFNCPYGTNEHASRFPPQR